MQDLHKKRCQKKELIAYLLHDKEMGTLNLKFGKSSAAPKD